MKTNQMIFYLLNTAFTYCITVHNWVLNIIQCWGKLLQDFAYSDPDPVPRPKNMQQPKSYLELL